MDFDWPAELVALRAEVDSVLDDVADRFEFCDDSWITGHDPDFDLLMAEHGWIGMTWPTEWGGHDKSPVERFVVTERLLERGAPIAGSWFPDRQMGPVILQFGTDYQKRQFLPDIVAGRSRWCIGMSEPDAGSNVAGIRTKAVRDGDDFVVDGSKVWTSGAHHAEYCYLICRTDPDAAPHKGLSELVVDMSSPGIEVRPIRDAALDEHFNEVLFDEVRVPADNLVGELNGSFGQTMRQLEHERGGADRLVSNRRLYDGIRPLADTSDPIVRQKIAAIESAYVVGRLMVLRNVFKQAPPGYSAVTKTWCTEFEQRVADFAASVLGPEATLWNDTSRNVMYATAYTIMGGTTEILRNIVGERVLGLPREPRI